MRRMATLMNKTFVDVIRVLDATGATSGLSKDEILRCLTNSDVLNTVRESGLPDIQWTKNLPTSKVVSTLISKTS